MTNRFSQGDGVLFMKVGTHAQEPLEEIIARKRKEIEDAGFALWGYGGNTCHPASMVQPFAKLHAEVKKPILLVMEPMESRHFAEPLRAAEYSVDGVHWQEVPDPINVKGSRYALWVRDIEQVDEELDLGHTRVAIGNSKGKPGSDYIKGHVDKACLNVVEEGIEPGRSVKIGLMARILEPYAVFLRTPLEQ